MGIWRLPELAMFRAYDTYFMLLATNEKEAIKFVNGVMPADLVAEASKQNKISAATTPIKED